MLETDKMYFYQNAGEATNIKYHYGKSLTLPDECPICSKGINPELHYSLQRNLSNIQIVLRCPIEKCGKFFIASYFENILQECYPKIFNKKPTFSEEIINLSETFVEIYNQALEAENLSLNQISGVGYRKAFEFLIKDYLIKIKPEIEDEIKSKFLGKCINEFIEDVKIKETAKRAAWLGNDETHYERIWDDKDIEDLKMLIHITVHWLSMEMLTIKYNEEMQK